MLYLRQSHRALTVTNPAASAALAECAVSSRALATADEGTMKPISYPTFWSDNLSDYTQGAQSLENRTLILSFSGGKDSGATWLALREHGHEPDHILCTDTGWEALEWYEHMRRFQDFMRREVTMVRASIVLPEHLLPYAQEVEVLLGIGESPMVRAILKNGIFPSRLTKFCTRILKTEPCAAWVDDHDLDGALQVTGVRADESRSRALYPVTEMNAATRQMHWRPILDWSVGDVLELHRRYKAPLCSLYDMGASRVGCWPCMPSANKDQIAMLDDRRIAAIRRLEQIVNHLRQSTRVGAVHMSIGDVDGVPDIDTAVAHAKTFRGGHRDQGRLFEKPRLDTCARWGVCDTGDDVSAFSC